MQNCRLCHRDVPESLITLHHLTPKSRGGKPENTIPLCRPCHAHLHVLFDNKTLASELNTIDALRRQPAIQKFIRFIRKQDPGARFSSRKPVEKRRAKRRRK